ncbi:hypothetical protein [Agromyces humi]|uniref:hypothetical protein n=1 Tax=Agromyces humi TaxID=1766800 RepID=UPI00135A00FA|nr:hypothetical protein [Agromyces humi]
MRQIFAGLFFIAGLLLFFFSFAQDSFAAGIPWALGGIVSAVIGLAMSQAKPQTNIQPDNEDLTAKARNREVALQLAATGGMQASMARQWLQAYEKDSSVPIFGVRPYWTPTGPGGAPQLLSTIGLRGIDDRLEYVRQAAASDPLLPIIVDDPNRLVREAARARLA